MESRAGTRRRVGAATSKTRYAVLDAVERLMIDEGYAAVTYRAVAGRAGVTPALVQYYFPTLDDVFVAAIRRRVERNVERLEAALRERADEPLRVLWDFSREEAAAALTTEFMALGNHRKSIRSEIAEVTERVRRVQLDALQTATTAGRATDRELPPAALLFLLTGIPKLITLEAGVGVSTGHAEVMAAFERYLESVEPPGGTGRRRRRAGLLRP
jgi:TetR/AcrR family transcriptional regulator, transcriptional repressor for nem operon